MKNFIISIMLIAICSNPIYSQLFSDKPLVNISGNFVGMFLLGATANAEIALTDNFSIGGSYRIGSLGLRTEKDFPDKESSEMIGFSVRYYPIPVARFTGIFVAPTIEFGSSQYKIPLISQRPLEIDVNTLLAGAEIGYHWIFENGMSLEFSDKLVVLASKVSSSETEGKYHADRYVWYDVSIKFGFAF